MIPKQFITAVFCLMQLIGWSQTYSVQGKVMGADNTAISYANVILLNTESQAVITGTSTDEEGAFYLEDIQAGTYLIRVSFIGYADYENTLEVQSEIILETITLEEEAETLSEVQLNVVKPTLVQRPDRLIFNVEQTALSEGSILDAVRRTPGVVVLDNALVVKNTSPAIYINDRRVNLEASDVLELLEATPASNIRSVELITNPSARYDADSGVVLNINMSSNLIAGYNGSVYTNYTQGVFPKYNAGTSHYFKSKAFDLYLNYSYNDRKINREGLDEVFYPGQVWSSDIDRNTWSDTHTVNLNMNIDLDDRNQLSFSSNMLFLPFFEYIIRNRTDIVPAGLSEVAAFNSRNFSTDLKHNMGFDFDYRHRFAKDNSRLNFNAHFTTYDYSRDQRVDSDYFLGDETFFESNAYKTRSDQDTEIATSQLDYYLPFKSGGSFEIGAKYSNVQTNSGIVRKDIIGAQEIINPDNTDMFDYDEKVYAGFMNVNTSFGKWELMAGVRAEQTDVVGRSESVGKDNNQNYLEWFPTGSLGYNISDRVQAYGNYKRSIIRPNYTNLNPFSFFLNDNTIVVGNPDLQPVFVDHFVGGISLDRTYKLEVYYKESDNSIYEFPVQDNLNNILRYTPINLDLTTEWGIDLLTYFDLLDNWGLTAITSFYNTKDEGTFNDVQVDQDQWSNYSYLANNFSFLKDKSLTVDLIMILSTRNIQGFQTVDGRLMSNLAIKKSFLKGKAIASLTVNDLFNEADFFVRTRFLDQNSTAFTNLDNRYVQLGFRYRFGNIGLGGEEEELDKEELKRLEDDN